MRAIYKKYVLNFKRPSGTSRGVLLQKETWFLIIEDNEKQGIGECGILRGLSPDDVPEYEATLRHVCELITQGTTVPDYLLTAFPSIRFGLEQAYLSLKASSPFELFPSDFVHSNKSIPINGLVWMGDIGFMHDQIQQKIEEGFHCLKLKIGAIDFHAEMQLLATIRKQYSRNQIALRVDANGAFTAKDALQKLNILSTFDIHSIEQPIRQGHWEAMARLCQESPVPIALDEELIGVSNVTKKRELLQTIQPQYLILKPSLLGGFASCEEWIRLAEELEVCWWVTSALESTVGLNAIAQWTYTLGTQLPQGLGTGGLYTNNFRSPLEVQKGNLLYNKNTNWKTNLIPDLCI